MPHLLGNVADDTGDDNIHTFDLSGHTEYVTAGAPLNDAWRSRSNPSHSQVPNPSISHHADHAQSAVSSYEWDYRVSGDTESSALRTTATATALTLPQRITAYKQFLVAWCTSMNLSTLYAQLRRVFPDALYASPLMKQAVAEITGNLRTTAADDFDCFVQILIRLGGTKEEVVTFMHSLMGDDFMLSVQQYLLEQDLSRCRPQVESDISVAFWAEIYDWLQGGRLAYDDLVAKVTQIPPNNLQLPVADVLACCFQVAELYMQDPRNLSKHLLSVHLRVHRYRRTYYRLITPPYATAEADCLDETTFGAVELSRVRAMFKLAGNDNAPPEFDEPVQQDLSEHHANSRSATNLDILYASGPGLFHAASAQSGRAYSRDIPMNDWLHPPSSRTVENLLVASNPGQIDDRIRDSGDTRSFESSYASFPVSVQVMCSPHDVSQGSEQRSATIASIVPREHSAAFVASSSPFTQSPFESSIAPPTASESATSTFLSRESLINPFDCSATPVDRYANPVSAPLSVRYARPIAPLPRLTSPIMSLKLNEEWPNHFGDELAFAHPSLLEGCATGEQQDHLSAGVRAAERQRLIERVTNPEPTDVMLSLAQDPECLIRFRALSQHHALSRASVGTPLGQPNIHLPPTKPEVSYLYQSCLDEFEGVTPPELCFILQDISNWTSATIEWVRMQLAALSPLVDAATSSSPLVETHELSPTDTGVSDTPPSRNSSNCVYGHRVLSASLPHPDGPKIVASITNATYCYSAIPSSALPNLRATGRFDGQDMPRWASFERFPYACRPIPPPDQPRRHRNLANLEYFHCYDANETDFVALSGCKASIPLATVNSHVASAMNDISAMALQELRLWSLVRPSRPFSFPSELAARVEVRCRLLISSGVHDSCKLVELAAFQRDIALVLGFCNAYYVCNERIRISGGLDRQCGTSDIAPPALRNWIGAFTTKIDVFEWHAALGVPVFLIVLLPERCIILGRELPFLEMESQDGPLFEGRLDISLSAWLHEETHEAATHDLLSSDHSQCPAGVPWLDPYIANIMQEDSSADLAEWLRYDVSHQKNRVWRNPLGPMQDSIVDELEQMFEGDSDRFSLARRDRNALSSRRHPIPKRLFARHGRFPVVPQPAVSGDKDNFVFWRKLNVACLLYELLSRISIFMSSFAGGFTVSEWSELCRGLSGDRKHFFWNVEATEYLFSRLGCAFPSRLMRDWFSTTTIDEFDHHVHSQHAPPRTTSDAVLLFPWLPTSLASFGLQDRPSDVAISDFACGRPLCSKLTATTSAPINPRVWSIRDAHYDVLTKTVHQTSTYLCAQPTEPRSTSSTSKRWIANGYKCESPPFIGHLLGTPSSIPTLSGWRLPAFTIIPQLNEVPETQPMCPRWTVGGRKQLPRSNCERRKASAAAAASRGRTTSADAAARIRRAEEDAQLRANAPHWLDTSVLAFVTASLATMEFNITVYQMARFFRALYPACRPLHTGSISELLLHCFVLWGGPTPAARKNSIFTDVAADRRKCVTAMYYIVGTWPEVDLEAPPPIECSDLAFRKWELTVWAAYMQTYMDYTRLFPPLPMPYTKN